MYVLVLIQMTHFFSKCRILMIRNVKTNYILCLFYVYVLYFMFVCFIYYSRYICLCLWRDWQNKYLH